jgi:hypothetical protein
MQPRRVRRAIWWSAAILVLSSVAYPLMVRPWHQRWGATQEESGRPMAGDDAVKRPTEVTTRAVTVAARPEHIWPWLMQLGNRRGGLYSYDWIDLLIGALQSPSVDDVLPQFQDLRVGDVVPYAVGTPMRVEVLERHRTLLLAYRGAGVVVTQSWGVYPLDEQRSRLVLRVRAQGPVTWRRLPALLLLDPAEFVMVRKQLLGIKWRAERLAASQRAYHRKERYP